MRHQVRITQDVPIRTSIFHQVYALSRKSSKHNQTRLDLGARMSCAVPFQRRRGDGPNELEKPPKPTLLMLSVA